MGQRLAPLGKARTPPHPGGEAIENFSVVGTFFGVTVAEWPSGSPMIMSWAFGRASLLRACCESTDRRSRRKATQQLNAVRDTARGTREVQHSGACREMLLPASGVASVGHKIADNEDQTTEQGEYHVESMLRDATAGDFVRGPSNFASIKLVYAPSGAWKFGERVKTHGLVLWCPSLRLHC